MRNAIASLALLVITAACTGVAARNEALIPAMEVAWVNIQEDVRAGAAVEGVDVEPTIFAMTEALASGDRYQVLAVDWASMRTLAITGITSQVTNGEIGPGVAASLIERITNFDDAYQVLARR